MPEREPRWIQGPPDKAGGWVVFARHYGKILRTYHDVSPEELEDIRYGNTFPKAVASYGPIPDAPHRLGEPRRFYLWPGGHRGMSATGVYVPHSDTPWHWWYEDGHGCCEKMGDGPPSAYIEWIDEDTDTCGGTADTG